MIKATSDAIFPESDLAKLYKSNVLKFANDYKKSAREDSDVVPEQMLRDADRLINDISHI
jgi:hypothetical protein